MTDETDASDVALGGILMQRKGEKYSVIATVSKLFSTTERKWSATERECFAVLYCCRKLDYFLSGAQFTVQTDHNSLVYLDRKNFNNAKISRWQSELSWYNFVVEYNNTLVQVTFTEVTVLLRNTNNRVTGIVMIYKVQ